MAVNVSTVLGKADRKLNDQLSYLPCKLLNRLMNFQKEGVIYALKHDGRCLIGDEMGLGKTLQALAVAYYYREQWPLLIVTPSSLRYPWIDEIEKWFPEIDPMDINLIQAGTDIADIPNARITVVTYGLLRCPSSTVLQEALLNQEFKMVIVDESHYLKNRRSQTSKYLVPLIQKTTHKVLLTGTPALARPEELFPQVDAICRGKFGTWSQYAKRFCDAKWQYFGRQRKRWVTDGASNLQELESLLRYQCMIRRLKKDVLTQLPPKQRQKISFPLKESTVKKDLDQTWKELDSAMGHGTSMNTVLSSAQEGTKAAAESSTFNIHRLVSTVYRKTAAVKIGPVREYIKMLCDNQGLKFLIFAHHHVMMDAISEQLHDDKITFIRIDGNTDQQERPILVQKFQSDKNIRVAILSIKAAGVGLTLTAASLVVFAELDWTPGVLEQCEDRAHRIGQQGTVHIHYLVAKGTLDEWVWSALAKKTTVVSTTLNGKRQVLQMDEGHRGQIDCLANAEAWVPRQKEENEEQDIGSFFASQQPKGQRSLHQYFTPKGRKRKKSTKSDEESPSKTPKSRRKQSIHDSDTMPESEKSELRFQSLTPNRPNQGNDPESDMERSKVLEVDVVVIDSDSDCDMHTPKASNTKGKTGSASKTPEIFSLGTSSGSRRSTSKDPSKNISMNNTRKEEITVVKAEKKWSCGQCTFLNHQALPFCEMCSFAKSKSKKMNTTDSDKDFSKCSYVSDGELPDIDIRSSPQPCASKSDRSIDKHLSKVPKIDEISVKKGAGSQKKEPPYPKQSRQRNSKRRDSAEDFSGLWGLDLDLLDSDLEDETSEPTTVSSHPPNDEDNASEDLFSALETDNDVSDNDSDCSIHDGLERSALEAPKKCRSESELNKSVEDVIQEEMVAAGIMFGSQTNPDSRPWTCQECSMENQSGDTECEGCLASRPKETEVKSSHNPEQREVNLDEVPTYEQFQYGCSKNTSRIYLYDLTGNPLHVNFQPLDVEMKNFSALPDLLLHPSNLRLVKRFVREWNGLAATKRRVIVKSGEIFNNPLMMYENIKMGRVQSSKQRFTSKADVAAAAVNKANAVNGTIRIVKPATVPLSRTGKSPAKKTPQKKANQRLASPENEGGPNGESASNVPVETHGTTPKKGKGFRRKKTPVKRSQSETAVSLPDTAEEFEKLGGLVQAVGADGTPLCVTCQKPYKNKLVSERTVQENPWLTRFCSQTCAEKLWTRRHGTYNKKKVFELEHGVCQICGLDAQEIFRRISITRDHSRRAELIQDSVYSCLKPEIKEKMVRNPHKGQFWQVDHINPVAEGGGECDIDNLRTLCTCCHRDVTAKQNKERAARRRLPSTKSSSKGVKNIRDFFQRS